MATPRVSIIILNYNGEKYLRRLLLSLSTQSFIDFEIIFIDNCSTDNSIKQLECILAEEQNKHLKIHVIENKTNLGFCKGNNVGIKYANGDYVVFLNNDTFVASSWLEVLIKIMDSHSKIGVSQSRIISVKTGLIQTDGWLLDKFGCTSTIIIPESVKTDFFVAPFYVSGTSLIIRRDLLKILGGFDSKLFSGDFDLCWQVRLLGYDIATIPASLCYHYGQVATRELYSSRQLALSSDKEFLRVFLKNYQGSFFIAILRLLIRMFGVSLFNTFSQKDPRYLSIPLRALYWNLKLFSNTLLLRCMIKNRRSVNTSIRLPFSEGSIELKRMFSDKKK